MIKKCISYQHLLLMDVLAALPELGEFFVDHVSKCGEISLGEGSLVETHVDSSSLLDYKKNSCCSQSEINATEGPKHMLCRRYEQLFDSYEVESLTTVYQTLYLGVPLHIPMTHERFNELRVFNETFVSLKSKGSQSSAVCANWAGVGGNFATDNSILCVGLVQYFIRHAIRLPVSASESKRLEHIFARVSWYMPHPRESWFHHRTVVVSTDTNNCGPATFLPVSRIHCRCAMIKKTVKFDYGEDSVYVSVLCGSNYCV